MKNDNNTIKAVIFDLGRVLIDVDLTRGIFKHFKDINSGDDLAIMERLFCDPLYIGFGTGKITPRQFYKGICEKTGMRIDYDKFIDEWCDVFNPMDGIEEIFLEVSKRFPVGLLSDVDSVHWNYLKNNLSFLKTFKKPTLSFEIGFLKPNSECYSIAANNVGQPVENCLFIDDRIDNVKGALNAGMKALQFKGTAHLRKELIERGIIYSFS